MDKKFLSAEEAIVNFGLDPAEFQHLVDEGEVRALADRGTWKYRRDEIVDLIGEGVLKAKHPAGDGGPAIEADSKTPVESVSFLEIDEEALAEGAAAHRESTEESEDTTPSEVYLVDEGEAKPAAEPLRPGKGSVSDVQLVAEPAAAERSEAPPSESVAPAEDDIGTVELAAVSDVPVAESLSELDIVIASEPPKAGDSSVIVSAEKGEKPESDSDVKVVPEAAGGPAKLAGGADHALAAEDSGIALGSSILASGSEIAQSRSDSDVKVIDSGVSLGGEDSGITLGGSSVASDSAFIEKPSSEISLDSSSVIAGDSAFLESDSGITLGSSSVAGDSAFLEKPDSGLSLESGESGISLESSDSGISLDSGDSGISLEAGDSGISLEAIADSGISLEADSGIQLDARTGRPKGPKRPTGTEVEIPGMDSAEFDSPDFGDTSEDTTLLVTDDEDALETIAPKKGKRPAGLSGSIAEEVEELDIAEDLDGGELDVEAIEEDEELVEDILEASDEVFATEESGELSGELSADQLSAVAARSTIGAGLEPAWDVAAVIPVVLCAVLLAANALMLWEGVATMWTGSEPAFAGALIGPLSGLF